MSFEEAERLAHTLTDMYPLTRNNIDLEHPADFDTAMRVIHTLQRELRAFRQQQTTTRERLAKSVQLRIVE